MMEGRNLLLRENSRYKKFGFFTTRRIEAESANLAKKSALTLVRAELINIMLNSADDPLSLDIESIEEVVSFGSNPVPGKGFSLYPETEK